MSGRTLPKFGEWDLNDPASAEGFTVIFNKARDEKKGVPDEQAPPGIMTASDKNNENLFRTPTALATQQSNSKLFCCCFRSGPGDAT